MTAPDLRAALQTVTAHCPSFGWTPNPRRYPDPLRAVAIHRVSECLGPGCAGDVSPEFDAPAESPTPTPISFARRMRYAAAPIRRRRRKESRTA